MLSRDIVEVGARRATVRRLDDELVQIRFQTEGGRSLRVTMPEAVLDRLVREITELTGSDLDP